jgi:hypothetical protein
MNNSFFAAACTLILVTACASEHEDTATVNDDITSAKPCESLACGEVCGSVVGYPGVYPKICNAQKQCVVAGAGVTCPATPPPPPPPKPCESLACGEVCGSVVGYPGVYPKICDAQKQCVVPSSWVTCP